MSTPRPAWLPAQAHRAADALEAAGVPVAYDLRSVSPPVVLMLPVAIRAETGCIAEVDVQVDAVAPGPNHGDAVGWLWGKVAPVLAPHCDLEAVMFEQYPGLEGEITGTVELPVQKMRRTA